MTVDAGMERFMREPGELYLRQIAVHQEAGKKLGKLPAILARV
jgi:hypothetical protein